MTTTDPPLDFQSRNPHYDPLRPAPWWVYFGGLGVVLVGLTAFTILGRQAQHRAENRAVAADVEELVKWAEENRSLIRDLQRRVDRLENGD